MFYSIRLQENLLKRKHTHTHTSKSREEIESCKVYIFHMTLLINECSLRYESNLAVIGYASLSSISLFKYNEKVYAFWIDRVSFTWSIESISSIVFIHPMCFTASNFINEYKYSVLFVITKNFRRVWCWSQISFNLVKFGLREKNVSINKLTIFQIHQPKLASTHLEKKKRKFYQLFFYRLYFTSMYSNTARVMIKCV